MGTHQAGAKYLSKHGSSVLNVILIDSVMVQKLKQRYQDFESIEVILQANKTLSE